LQGSESIGTTGVQDSAQNAAAKVTLLLMCGRYSYVCVAAGPALQKELTKKVQRLDALQADVNTAADARTAAEAKAEELAKQADLLRQQLAVLGSKDGELQTLAADLAAAASAKAALEAKVGAGQRIHFVVTQCWAEHVCCREVVLCVRHEVLQYGHGRSRGIILCCVHLPLTLLHCCCLLRVVHPAAQLAPKEKQLQEARARNNSLSEQLRSLGSQLTDVQRDLQRAREDASSQVKVSRRMWDTAAHDSA
jgi:multidrug efflux pump subunit AcrA (membrane-fusion protein)